MKSKGERIMSDFGFIIQLPQFYTPDQTLLDTLKICIEEKESNPSNLERVSR